MRTDKDWIKGCESLAMGDPLGNAKKCLGLVKDFPVWEDWKQWSYYLAEVKAWRAENPELAEFMLFAGKLKWQLENRVKKTSEEMAVEKYNKTKEEGDWLCECGHHNTKDKAKAIGRSMETCSKEGCGYRKGHSLVEECVGENDREAVDLVAKRMLCDKCLRADRRSRKQAGHRGRCKGWKKGV